MTAYLYDARGHDREIALDEALTTVLGRNSLLWIDLLRGEPDELAKLTTPLKLDPRSAEITADADAKARLHNFGDYLQLRVFAPRRSGKAGDGEPCPLDFLVGDNWLVTVHDGDIGYIPSFRDQDKAETRIGALSAAALAATLLDWHLSSFFDALARIEAEIDKLDERTLGKDGGEAQLTRMLALRQQVARLRAVLSSQRGVFYGLARPDFMLAADDDATSHLRGLAGRFERAIDEVERGRDLVAASFDLFASRTAQQTNELVKVLTFVTVITGVFAAVAGLMGMNFKAAFFDSGSTGFFAVTFALSAAAILAGWIARRRRWL